MPYTLSIQCLLPLFTVAEDLSVAVMKIGERIRRQRKKPGIDLRQLAACTGLTSGFLSQIEYDQTSPRQSVPRYCRRTPSASVSLHDTQPNTMDVSTSWKSRAPCNLAV